MIRSTKALSLALPLLTLAACSAIIGTRDLTLVDGDDGGIAPLSDAAKDDATSSHDGAGPGADASPDGSDGAAPTCGASTDYVNDPHNCGRCGHDCLGGDCKNSACQPVTIVQGQPGAASVAVDGTSVYWCGNWNNQVLKADKDGKNVTILADEGSYAESAYGIALDDAYVYWASNVQGGVVARCAKAGCNKLPTLMNDGNLDLPRAVAVAGTTVYWAENDVVGSVGRSQVDGGGFGYLVTNERNLFNLAVDDASVFFVSQIDVGRVSRSASVVDSGEADATAPVETIFSGGLWATGVALDDTNVYWAENNDPGAIRFAPKSGLADGGVPTVIAESERNPWHIVVDATNVYWSATGPDSGDGTVSTFVDGYVATCPKAGCGSTLPTILASGIANARGIAMDDSAVYVAYYGNESDQGTVSAGGILRIAKP